MGIDRFRAVLTANRRIALDTSIFIYQLDASSKYLEFSGAVFRWLSRPGNAAVTSTLSLTELLVPAYREADESRARFYYALLLTYPNLTWVPPSFEVADEAARLRARYRLKTPDAIHAATAIHSDASVFVTNDPVFKRIKEITSVILDDLL